MKFNFKWNKGDKQEITPEITERNVNVYEHSNPIKGAEHLSEKKCRVCGKWFEPNSPVQVICSRECRMEAERQYQRRHYQEMKAKQEGKINEQGKEGKMYSEPIIRANGKRWTPPIKTCPTCGKVFVATNNKQIYCCRECLMKASNSYNAYRKTPKNKKTSEQADSSKKDPFYRPYFWKTQAGIIAKLVKSGVDDDIVAKYLKTVFGGK